MTKLLRGNGAMAVAPHHLASEAAVTVMDQGGSAVDGAIAANAVLAVVLPDTCGPGGDLFALVHAPGATEPTCLNSSGRAGSGASAEELRDAGYSEVPFRGPWGITVPGCVDGWEALSDRYGVLPLSQVLQPAIELCDGFPASAELASSLARAKDWVAMAPAAAALFPNGGSPDPGQTLVRPQLAATLQAVAKGGREAFFARIGEHLTDVTGGRIAKADYGRPQADWVDPITIEVFGRQAWTVPPNSQGYLTLAAAYIAEQLDLPTAADDPRFQHGLIEAYRAVSWERNELVADATRTPGVTLLDPDRLESRVAAISMSGVAEWPDPPEARAGTAFMCAVDSAGMGVSLIQSNYTGIGSGLSAGDTGVFLHNRGAGFNLREGHANELTPGQRPLHTLAPTLWTNRGELDTLLGTRGGHLQPQLLLQVAANRMLAGLDAAAAMAAPRWSLDELAGIQPVRVEPGFTHGLDGLGHDVETTSDQMEGWGPVSLIELAAGTRVGAADPRVSTAAVAAD